GDQIRAINGLTINGTLNFLSGPNYTVISSIRPQNLSCNWHCILDVSSSHNYLSPNAVLMIAAGFTLRGGGATVGEINVPLTNEEIGRASCRGRVFSVEGRGFMNQEKIESGNGSNLDVTGDMHTLGLLKEQQG